MGGCLLINRLNVLGRLLNLVNICQGIGCNPLSYDSLTMSIFCLSLNQGVRAG